MATTTFEQIQIDRETIGKALREKRLRVDTHQREYAWEEDHIVELYQDFSDVITSGVADISTSWQLVGAQK